MTLYEAYCAGWHACLNGTDGRVMFETTAVLAKYAVTANIALRVYRDAPGSVHFQVRTQTTKQSRISGVSLTFDEVRALRDALNEMIGSEIR